MSARIQDENQLSETSDRAAGRTFRWRRRGGALALGILPFITATIVVRLTRVVSPEMERMSRTSEGRASLTRWTRVLTTALALVQSYGFARFVQAVPGAVDNPGFGFIGQTMLVLTTGSLVAMAVTERIAQAVADDDGRIDLPGEAEPLALGEGVREGAPLRAAEREKVR